MKDKIRPLTVFAMVALLSVVTLLGRSDSAFATFTPELKVVVETPDGDVIAIRSIMNMVLGVDHRANDGAGGAALLRDIKAWLEAVGPDTAIF